MAGFSVCFCNWLRKKKERIQKQSRQEEEKPRCLSLLAWLAPLLIYKHDHVRLGLCAAALRSSSPHLQLRLMITRSVSRSAKHTLIHFDKPPPLVSIFCSFVSPLWLFFFVVCCLFFLVCVIVTFCFDVCLPSGMFVVSLSQSSHPCQLMTLTLIDCVYSSSWSNATKSELVNFTGPYWPLCTLVKKKRRLSCVNTCVSFLTFCFDLPLFIFLFIPFI